MVARKRPIVIGLTYATLMLACIEIVNEGILLNDSEETAVLEALGLGVL